MAGINIPGITDQYKTNETIEKLMQIERIPLNREQKTLDSYKAQQDAWRSVNRKVTSLRDSVKSLYSFENPFNNKLCSSTDEFAISADATRKAAYDSFKIDVIQPATADRFLTSELDADTKVPAGTYTYKINDKSVVLRWKGGSLNDFSSALNRRGNDLIKTRVIGASKGKKTLSIESLKTGEENRLNFEGDAKSFAETSGMILRVKPKSVSFGSTRNEFKSAPEIELEQQRMPVISNSKLSVTSSSVTVPPRNGFSISIPQEVKETPNNHVLFTVKKQETTDITIALNKQEERPNIPDSGSASFKDVTIYNANSDPNLPDIPVEKPEPLDSISTPDVFFAILKDGTEKLISTPSILKDTESEIDINLSDYPDIESIAMRNRNTGISFTVSTMQAYNPSENLGFIPQHPITVASDAIIKYEGITIKRPENDIDDVVPEVTLHVHEKTEKTATIKIDPDVEAAKEALITFVGQYNQAVAEINVLSQNKPEIVDELDYLSDDEQEKMRERLGVFNTDSSLTSLKSGLQSATSSKYGFSDTAEVTMLSQIGIATNASSYTGYTPSKLRGYLEIDEKTLDAQLAKNLEDIKNLFGYDSDGDLIIDSGIGYKLDKQCTAYVQSGGIFAMKTASLDSKIKSSEKKITQLEASMSDKEADLRNKYGTMEGTLNSLESQQNTIKNFTNRGNNN